MVARGHQPTLCDVLPVGVWLFREMVGRAEQEAMREELREVAEAAPFLKPKMPGGVDFRLKLTNCGEFGWVADGYGRFRYERTQQHPKRRGKPWPEIPPTVAAVTGRAARESGNAGRLPNACLVNYYGADGQLGQHRDDTNGEDFDSPIYTISLGDTARFLIGGLAKTDKTHEVELNSGDVLVMAGDARRFYHEVKRILPGTSDLLAKGGRISATLRRVLW